jgi:hypothetical protein
MNKSQSMLTYKHSPPWMVRGAADYFFFSPITLSNLHKTIIAVISLHLDDSTAIRAQKSYRITRELVRKSKKRFL